MNKKQWAIVVVFGLALAAWFTLDLGQYLQFSALRENIDALQAYCGRLLARPHCAFAKD